MESILQERNALFFIVIFIGILKFNNNISNYRLLDVTNERLNI